MTKTKVGSTTPLTINNYKLQGIKGVLIKLETYLNEEAVTTTESGIIIPKYNTHETDGGRFVAAMTNEKYTTLGTILQISTAAEINAAEINMDVDKLKVGARVAVSEQTKSSPTNWFFPNRDEAVAEHVGYLLVTPAAIQAFVTQ